MLKKRWEIFEEECTQYLNARFGEQTGCNFVKFGGHNSVEPDIIVYNKDNERLFSMEVKLNSAQCGQFVLFPDESEFIFRYSARNEFPINQFSRDIINLMARDYYKYNTPSNKTLDFDKRLFYNWVINHYKVERGSEYLITKGKDFVIFNINKLEKYFDISAVYRTKKSGSTNPAKSDIADITKMLDASQIKYNNLQRNERYTLVQLPCCNYDKITQKGGKFTYLYKRTEGGFYKVTRLSNTYNANVIFSIQLKMEQDEADLEEFISSLV